MQLVATEATGGTLSYEHVLSMGRADAADAEVDGGAVAWLFYTSGTTGRPKGAMLTHRNILAMAMNVFADIYPFIGMEDDIGGEWGEAVMALVVLAPGAHLTEGAALAFCRDHLAGYKKPKRVEFVAGIPRNAYGKVTRRELREPYWQGRARCI